MRPCGVVGEAIWVNLEQKKKGERENGPMITTSGCLERGGKGCSI